MAKRAEGSDAASALQKWADGKATLRDVRRYSDQELYAIARAAYVYYHQGKLEQARTLFQGLYAIDPTDSYAAKALGVVELAAGNFQGALSAYDVAIRLNAQDMAAHVGRAEVQIALGKKSAAAEDLRRALACEQGDEVLRERAGQMLALLGKRAG